MRRRDFLRATSGAAGATAAATSGVAVGAVGSASAQAQPDFGGWLEDVDGGFTDARGEGEVTVAVGAEGNGGAFAFEPAGLWVDPGTTVVWEWTGEGGGHNVASQEGDDFASDIVSEAGATFEHTFEEGGITTYQCDPHVSLGMKGAVAVGDEVPTAGGGGGGDGEGGGGEGGGGGGLFVPDSAKTIGVAATTAMVATLGLAFVLLKYGGGSEPEPPE